MALTLVAGWVGRSQVFGAALRMVLLLRFVWRVAIASAGLGSEVCCMGWTL